MLNNQHTKYIGIDFGKKRTGISISDYDKVVSFPLETIERIDERYTSKISKKIIHQLHSKNKTRMDKSIIDKISASLILESYLIKMHK